MSFRIRFTRGGRQHTQWRDTQSEVDSYLAHLHKQGDREDIRVDEAARPLTIHEKVNEIARRINGLRVGEGNDTIDVGDLIDNNRA